MIIVEDIVDTGLTLQYLQEILRARNPKLAADRVPAEQADRGARSTSGGVHRLHDRGPVRRRLRPRLRRADTATCRTSQCWRSSRADSTSDTAGRVIRAAAAPPPAPPASSSVGTCRSRISTLPFTIVVSRRRPGGVDEVRDRIVQRRLPRRCASTHDHVGALAGLERTDLRLEPQRAGPADRRHLQRRGGRHRARIARSRACAETRPCRIASNMSRSLLLAAPSVPSPTVTPAARYFGTGATPLASFMLLSGLCETPTPRPSESRCPPSCHPDAVRRQRARRPEANRIEIAAGVSRVTARCDRLHLVLVSARWMMSGTSYLRASARAAFTWSRSSVYGRVRRHGGRDQRRRA